MELSASGKEYLRSLREKFNPINKVTINFNDYIDAEFTSYTDGEIIEISPVKVRTSWWKRLQRCLSR
jgi:hypothetical protein